jgi:hypothetical protein
MNRGIQLWKNIFNEEALDQWLSLIIFKVYIDEVKNFYLHVETSQGQTKHL